MLAEEHRIYLSTYPLYICSYTSFWPILLTFSFFSFFSQYAKHIIVGRLII